MSKISKTTITFTVLHRSEDFPLPDEAWGEYVHPYAGPLGYLMREAWDGGMVGMESEPVTIPVPDEQVVERLKDLGNDGEFFDDEFSDDDEE